jgi:hypothetical protein
VSIGFVKLPLRRSPALLGGNKIKKISTLAEIFLLQTFNNKYGFFNFFGVAHSLIGH